ncbi:hypothetical protein [Oceanisphaera avium]|uniref:Uncharacterized protein n=1 Tax=Oceanisphaera avium TaxID=1903694 RepID=A0A1Y0CWE3_9GAMM|nr:hypothetical protein [Oceanisphaera avium]ART79217.1 hypothetical protein CBP12_02865 [Oceanisphaera avium]
MTEHHHWQLISTDDYQCPSAPLIVRLQRQRRRVLRTLKLVKSDSYALGDVQSGTEEANFSTDKLPIALSTYISETPWSSALCVLLDPPFSGTSAMAKTWAKHQARSTLTPPTLSHIKYVDIDGWWQQQSAHVHAQTSQFEPDNAWLIPDLTAYFLRCTGHMAFINAWLPRALAGEFGAGIVVCNSWAFAFLSHNWPAEVVNSHCLAPATPQLLRQLGFSGKHHQLARLLGEARGNLGVAWEIWQHHYKQQQALPELPLNTNDNTCFILYSLLIHNSLSFEELGQVIANLSEHELALQLLSLKETGVIEQSSEREPQWQVRALAYMRVREFLGGRDYLLDKF